MSVTLVNQSLKEHLVSQRSAMAAYPMGHPARFAVWQEYQVPVQGADSFHISEWAMVPIWEALTANGWPESTTLFPCKGMKRLALIAALERLMDVAVAQAMPTFTYGEMQDEDTIVGFNTQSTLEALEGLLAFLARNENVYSI